MSERRADRDRLEVLGDLPASVTVSEAVSVKELGRHGARVETRVPLQLESLHEFRLELGTVAIVVKGRVVHCGVSHVDDEAVIYTAGVEFVDVPGATAQVIGAFIDAVRAGRLA